MGISTQALTGAMQQYLQGKSQKQQQEQEFKNLFIKAQIENMIKQQQSKKMMEFLQGIIGGQGGQGAYLSGIDLETGIPKVSFQSPTEQMNLQEKQRAQQYQNRLNQYQMAKNIPTPNVSLVRAPQNQIRQALMARGIRNQLSPEFGKRNFTQDVSGQWKELTPRERGGKILINPMIEKISKNENAVYGLDNSVSILKANADKFSQFLGPGKDLLRNPMRSYVNKDLQDFLAWKANVQDAFQQYRVAITGAQASDKEIALLQKNRPNENDTYDVFMKKAEAVQKVGRQVMARYISNLGKAGYDVSGYENTFQEGENQVQGVQNNNINSIKSKWGLR